MVWRRGLLGSAYESQCRVAGLRELENASRFELSAPFAFSDTTTDTTAEFQGPSFGTGRGARRRVTTERPCPDERAAGFDTVAARFAKNDTNLGRLTRSCLDTFPASREMAGRSLHPQGGQRFAPGRATTPVRQVAEYLKVKDRTIYRLVAKREILGFKGWWFLAVQKKRDRPVGSRERGLAG